MASSRGIQRASRLTNGVRAKATSALRTSIRKARVTWLSSQPARTRTASQARITRGMSSARTRRGCAEALINVPLSVGSRRALPSARILVRRLGAHEEEVRHEEDEEPVLDHHIAGQGLLHG